MLSGSLHSTCRSVVQEGHHAQLRHPGESLRTGDHEPWTPVVRQVQHQDERVRAQVLRFAARHRHQRLGERQQLARIHLVGIHVTGVPRR